MPLGPLNGGSAMMRSRTDRITRPRCRHVDDHESNPVVDTVLAKQHVFATTDIGAGLSPARSSVSTLAKQPILCRDRDARGLVNASYVLPHRLD